MLKEELRLNYTLLRDQYHSDELRSASLKISNAILKLPIWSFDYYHLFLQIPEKKEIDTSFILAILQGKDKNVVVPKVGEKTQLINYLLTDSTRFRKNKWNIPEPVDGLEVPVKKIDVVFMPLLAFDLKGNRVGYGKGFYDHLLKECRLEVLKIGLSLFDAEVEISDIHENDIPMNYCVTPTKIYEF